MSTEKRSLQGIFLALAITLGVATGFTSSVPLMEFADFVSASFIKFLKLISMPMIFLSVVSAISGMQSMDEVKNLGGRVLCYTLSTTLIAAATALGLFLLINPVHPNIGAGTEVVIQESTSYLTHISNLIPDNILRPFIEENVIGVLFLSALLSLSILTLPQDKQKSLHQLFSSLFAALMQVTRWVLRIMPLGIWAFVALFTADIRAGMDASSLLLYLAVVVTANLVQGFVVLPLMLKWKGISPFKSMKGMMPALSVAFFSKSSSAALPMSMRCAEENMGVSRKVSNFTLPLCSTINMNACAAFILTTVLFVAMSHGVTFSTLEMISWIFIATVAALGNAGVPMGCYFLSSALLASMNVPLNILGVILPVYTMIDMLESAINVWSDSCVAAVVDKDLKKEEAAKEFAPAAS
ncbi:MAG: dicarboxylate/amino acid:cation symporter [Waddliaceae bacterium]|nr:dicarboxylate/amino acid:cation symporter [Waddliaceae bacterium]